MVQIQVLANLFEQNELLEIESSKVYTLNEMFARTRNIVIFLFEDTLPHIHHDLSSQTYMYVLQPETAHIDFLPHDIVSSYSR